MKINTDAVGGYNGGASMSASGLHSSGGGASHIATTTGLLHKLSTYKDSGGIGISKEILVVAGGGGGGTACVAVYSGSGGGFQGMSGEHSTAWSFDSYGSGGTQSLGGSGNTAGLFGEGGAGKGAPSCGAGGGGGWYGGGGGYIASAGGGSGYIGSSNLISGFGVTKHMTCYDCTTSDVAATRTQSNKTISTSTPQADVARIGNGYARITWMGDRV